MLGDLRCDLVVLTAVAVSVTSVGVVVNLVLVPGLELELALAADLGVLRSQALCLQNCGSFERVEAEEVSVFVVP